MISPAPSALSLCVYCSASNNLDQAHQALAAQVGAWAAAKNIRIIYGGGHVGMMGIMADAALAGGGEVYGVITRYLADKEIAHQGTTKLFTTQTMQERQRKMAELADAFLVLHGGIGTLAELSEILAERSLGLSAKKLIFYNDDGYWDDVLAWMEKAAQKNFIRQAPGALYDVVNDLSAAHALLLKDK